MRPLICAAVLALAITVAPASAQETSASPPASNSDDLTVGISPHPATGPIPVVVQPPLAAPAEPVLTGFNWVARPSGADYQRLYPQRAVRDGVMGQVTLDCLVVAEGRLVCTVESEDPPRYGFGDATLRLARNFRAAPQTSDGRSTQGGRVHIPITWRLGRP